LTCGIAVSVFLSAYGFFAAFGAIGGKGEAPQRAHDLADGVALAIESARYGSLLAAVNVGLLLVLTWKYRGSERAKAASEAQPSDASTTRRR